MKKNKLILVGIVLLLNFVSCVSNNDKALDKLKDEVVASEEYKGYVEAFAGLHNIDETILEKSTEGIKMGLTTKQEFEENFMSLVSPLKRKETLDYFKKLGIPNIELLLEERESLFNIEIPKQANKLGEKFPELKEYTAEQMLDLIAYYRDES